MAVLYVQNFDSLTLGNLNGQDSWGTSNVPQVVNTKAQTGTQSVRQTGTGTVLRDCSAQTSGTQYFAVLLNQLGNDGDGAPGRVMAEGSSGKIYMKWQNSSGNKFQYIDGAGYSDMFTATLDLWYIIEINFNNATDTYTFRWKVQGGSFSSTSAAKAYNSTATNIDRTYLEQDPGSVTTWITYIDSYSATDPDSSSVKTYLGLATASVKTVDGLAIASRKTWEGLA